MTHDRDLDQACAALYTGQPADTLPGELLGVIEAAIMHHPRSLQRSIGPSELGMDCIRCLAHKLGGTPEIRTPAWLPTIGTAVHEWLEGVFLRHEQARASIGMPARYLVEHRVTVGAVAAEQVRGNTDIYDTHSGTVVDWKIVGTTTLCSARVHGAKEQYRRQAMLYGLGWECRGFTVRNVLIFFLPRNAVSLRDAYPWLGPYDRALAEDTLARADALAWRIHREGLPAVLDSIPEHVGDDFTCPRYPDYRVTTSPPALTLGPAPALAPALAGASPNR